MAAQATDASVVHLKNNLLLRDRIFKWVLLSLRISAVCRFDALYFCQ